jgi:hypothetical protein
MSERLTNRDLVSAVNRYVNALRRIGIWSDEFGSVAYGAPYGLTFYLFRIDGEARKQHDLPGFQGDQRGFATKRELFNAIKQATRTLDEAVSYGVGKAANE